MVVDDIFENLQMLDKLLSDNGYRVLTFLSAQKALNALELGLPDLILLDINMPEMDGYEFSARAKLLRGSDDMPIIFVSAYQDVDIKTKAFAHGGVDYITKPYQHGELLARVAVHIQMQRLHKQLHKQNDQLKMSNDLLESSNRRFTRLNSQLERANSELDELNKAKSRFFSVISHEIRTPMSGAMGMLELMKDTTLDAQQRHYIGVIRRCGEASLNVLNEILDLSSIDSGRIAIDEMIFDLAALIDDCVGQFYIRSKSTAIALALDLTALGQTVVKGDPDRLRHILNKLLGNAFKYTQQGSVSIIVTRQSRLVRFEIRDTGIGMQPEQQSLIFKPFGLGAHSPGQSPTGSGLGLTICQELITLMRGDMGVESNPGGGTRIWFSLPLDQPADGERRAWYESEKAGVAQRRNFSRAKVLVAEDNDVNQLVIGEMLAQFGVSPQRAYDGRDAFEHVQRSLDDNAPYDLIFMDCDMPVIDGYLVTEKIRELETKKELKRIPIIALSAQVLSEQQRQAQECGMSDYLTKPMRIKQLAVLLEKYLL